MKNAYFVLYYVLFLLFLGFVIYSFCLSRFCDSAIFEEESKLKKGIFGQCIYSEACIENTLFNLAI